jgi:hypothetical protein
VATRTTPRKAPAKKTAAKKAPARAKPASAGKAAPRGGRSKAAAPPNKPVGRHATVEAYLRALPDDRRRALQAVREEINRRLPKGYAEGMQYGMIGWCVPHSLYPDGYHCDPKQPLPFVGLASQKNHMSLYLMCIYGFEEHRRWFEQEWAKTGKRLDMGKGCVRFKRLEDLPLTLVGEAVARVPVDAYLAHYEAVIKKGGKRRQ